MRGFRRSGSPALWLRSKGRQHRGLSHERERPADGRGVARDRQGTAGEGVRAGDGWGDAEDADTGTVGKTGRGDTATRRRGDKRIEKQDDKETGDKGTTTMKSVELRASARSAREAFDVYYDGIEG